jgi:hypothetical protein
MPKTKKSAQSEATPSHPWEGKTILSGLTWQTESGQVLDQRQFYGIITRVNEAEHIMEVDLANGQFWQLPYYPEVTMKPPHGVYKCRASGQEVVNPDLLMSWRVTQTEGGQQRGWQPNFLLFSEPVQPPEWEFTLDHDPAYIQQDILERGSQYLGKHLLVGIQYYELDPAGKTTVRVEQFHGEIVQANPSDGLVIRQPDGKAFKMPPDLTMLEPAPKAEFRLRATGEIVVNPDYVAAWAVDRRKKSDE